MLCGLAQLVHTALTVYLWIVLAAVVATWIRVDPLHPAARFLHRATEPVFAPVRKVLNLNLGGLDFSPVIVLLGIGLLDRLLVRLLHNLGMCY